MGINIINLAHLVTLFDFHPEENTGLKQKHDRRTAISEIPWFLTFFNNCGVPGCNPSEFLYKVDRSKGMSKFGGG